MNGKSALRGGDLAVLDQLPEIEREMWMKHVEEGPANPYCFASLHRVMKDDKPYSIWRPPYIQPYLERIYRSWHHSTPKGFRMVIQKGALLGITEMAINLNFWFMRLFSEDSLYMMPNIGQLSKFAQRRIDDAILRSDYLRQGFSDVDNVGLKIGWGNGLYLLGANVEKLLIEIAVGLLIRDELDRMWKAGAEQAQERLAASVHHKWQLDISNPSYPGMGINEAWEGGSQDVWKLKCKKGHPYEPVEAWPESIQDGKLVCPECGIELDEIDKLNGEWISLERNAEYESLRLSQLVSSTVTPRELERKWKAAQGDPTKMQIFYNFGLGLPYSTSASRLSPEFLRELVSKSGHTCKPGGKGCFLGIDPGEPNCWYVVLEGEKLIAAGCETTFEDLCGIMNLYQPAQTIIESEPEVRMAKAFARKFPGKVKLFDYRPGSSEFGLVTKEIEDLILVKMNRTELIDDAFAPLRRGEPILPSDASPDLLAHLSAFLRVKQEKRGGGEYYQYQKSGPDHLGHAYAFAHLAKRLGGTTVETPAVGPEMVGGESKFISGEETPRWDL